MIANTVVELVDGTLVNFLYRVDGVASFRTEARRRPLDFDRLFERHDVFHRTLLERCAGPETRAVLETVRPRLDRYEWYYAPLIGPDFRATYAEHDAIIRAVRSGDADAAERAMRANWWNGAERLAATIGDD
jgi:DNA-binding GntR family transcriptional regulator